MSKENQDYYKVGGRSGGPAGPLDRFKGEVSRSRAKLEREARGKGRPRRGAAEEVEQQLSDLHGEPHRHSVLDDLPKASGPAGVPAGRRPADPRPVRTPSPLRDFTEAGAEESADEGLPADYAVAEREAAPWADTDAAGEPTGPRLTPLQSGAVRLLAPAFKLLGGAARAVDRPVRRTLDVLLWLEREARGRA